jgi:hypothetical protein
MIRSGLGKAAKKTLKILAIAAAAAVTLTLGAGALFVFEVLSREPLRAVRSTTHPSLARRACIDCHAPIAEEWRQSYHHRSLTGPYWKDVRELGYKKVFDQTRKACVNCHAPANVLDLSAAAQAPAVVDGSLGVECTPNLLREPRGVIPAARLDDAELGVDCTSCHVGKGGIVGSGRRPSAAHEVLADRRFQDAVLASSALCGTCHAAAVRAWKTTRLACQGVTCLDCHMPATTAASTTGGPQRARRSHSFVGDKDPALLARAVQTSLEITPDRKARFRIVNDRVGHFFPSGGNWVSVTFRSYDPGGRLLREKVEAFGKEEPLILDFWPFNTDRRIASGEAREILFPLPEGPGTVEAVVRYHDWMQTEATVATLRREYPSRSEA